MLRKSFRFCSALSVCLSLAMIGAASPQPPASLTAAQIVEKNVSAKGGLQAWRSVETISFTGKMEAGGKQNVLLPFVLQKKRPRKTRVELVFANDTAVQVYDGANGWKLRPYLGRRDVEPYSPEELKSAALESDLDGPLVDYATKGNTVDLVGVEKVEGHDAYKLKITMKGGLVQHIWVDGETFLEIKLDGTPRRMDGKMRPVSVYLRDYKSVNGLMIPYVLETTVEGNKATHEMLIENVVVNPKLEDTLFAKPEGKQGGPSGMGVSSKKPTTLP
jgi:outer membrane lipoprotein-sorting protein